MKQLTFTTTIIFSLIVISYGRTFEEDLTLTSSQKRILDQFKELVADRVPHAYMKEDVYLVRWLRARYWKIPDAEKMLMDHLKWRKDNKIDNILNEDWSDLEQSYRYYLEGRDTEGKPLLYVNGGVWDLRQVVISGNRDRFNRYIDRALEDACTLVRKLGEEYKNVSQGILIVNMDGFNLVQHGCLQCITVFLRILVQYEAHHPGCADKIIVVNLPTAAEPILNAARAVFHPDTNRILQIFGVNKNKWTQVLAKYFDMDNQLPPELGGSKIYKGMEDDFNLTN